MDELALNRAAKEGDMKTVRQLVEGGVSVDSRDAIGRTPLHEAANEGLYEVAEYLISNKCDLNPKDSIGFTPLHWAIIRRRCEVTKLLISSKCDPNLKVEENIGFTPLHCATLFGFADGVHAILDSGEADPNAVCTSRTTPLMAAATNGLAEVASLLIRAGADVNRKDKKKLTALHRAAYFGRTAVMQVLLGVEGIDLNPQDNEDSTPLHLACIWGKDQVVRQLLEAGADTTLKNNQNETALSEGIGSRTFNVMTNIQEIIMLFVQHGHFLEDSEYARISADPVLSESVLRDVDLCTQSIVNKFNGQSLPALYNITHVARCLPPIRFMKLSESQTRQVAHFVASEIKAKTHCNVVDAWPKVLQGLCVLPLINRQA